MSGSGLAQVLDFGLGFRILGSGFGNSVLGLRI